jgi:hypothetical protein
MRIDGRDIQHAWGKKINLVGKPEKKRPFGEVGEWTQPS